MKNLKGILSLTLSLILAATLCGCGLGGNFKAAVQKSTDASGYFEADGTAVLENSGFKLEMDTATTHFTVTDLKTGIKYYSVPQFESQVVSDETQSRFVSELVLKYYDSMSGEFYMYSTADSAEKNGAAVTTDGNALRVTYTFGETDSGLFVPTVLTVEDYEAILESLTSSGRRRFKIYYDLYSADSPGKDFDAMAEKYPAIKSTDLYILSDTVSDSDRINVDKYVAEAGYTREDYEALMSELNISEAADDKPGFTVPVEYRLTDKGFTAAILTDLVAEASNEYKLTNLELLPFFAAEDAKAEGYFLVPDGTGALIEINADSDNGYVKRFYGNDVSKISDEQSMLVQNQYLPVFGKTSKSGAYLAVCEGAAATADLNVAVLSDSVPANSAWCTFDYRTFDTIQNSSMSGGYTGNGEGVYNLYGNATANEQPCVHYMLMGASSDYNAMASAYRGYLEENKTLESGSSDGGILIDYTCVVTTERSFCGVPYTEKIVLTTLADIKASLTRLYDAGLENISVRLIGYTDSGIQHGVNNKFSIYKKVGTAKELQTLADLIASKGGRLYLEADFQTVYSNSLSDGYSERNDTAYHFDKTLVKVNGYNVVTRENTAEGSPFYLSPLAFDTVAESFVKSLEKLSGVGVSYSTAGKILGGNYSSSSYIDRNGAIEAIEAAMQKGEKLGVIAGGGNIYAVTSAERLTDVTVYSSEYDQQLCSVPFWQTVMHGAVDYSSVAYNTSENRTRLLLKTVESGSDLHFSFIGASDELLIEKGLYETYSSLNDDIRLDTVISLYNELYSFREGVCGKRIASHKALGEGVYQTVYENGAYSVVNYTNSDFAFGSATVPANGYYLKGAE